MKKIVTVIVCAGLGIALILDSAGVRGAAANGVQLCLTTVIPSLFAFMALSSLVMSSGIVKGDTALFILSMAGGYPVGAKLLSDRVSSRGNPPAPPEAVRKAETMLMYCYCGSPAYLIAIVPAANPNSGLYIWLSNVLACAVFAIAVNVFTKKIPADSNGGNSRGNVQNSSNFGNQGSQGNSLVRAVTSSGNALYQVCLMIITFTVAIRLLEFAGIMRLLPDFTYPFLEITRLVSGNFAASPAVMAALTSTGGVCVMFQVWIICKNAGANMRLHKFILARIPIAVISGVFCRLLTGLAEVAGLGGIADNSVTASVNEGTRAAVSAGGSWVASACLMVMTLILIKMSGLKH